MNSAAQRRPQPPACVGRYSPQLAQRSPQRLKSEQESLRQAILQLARPAVTPKMGMRRLKISGSGAKKAAEARRDQLVQPDGARTRLRQLRSGVGGAPDRA